MKKTKHIFSILTSANSHIRTSAYLLFIITSANLLIATFAFSQQKAVQYDKDFVFKDGVYISFQDFKNNNPIPTSKIIFRSNQGDRDYLKLALSNTSFKYFDNSGEEHEMKVDSLWGYCSNGAVYINFGTDFNRMVVIGSLSHFVATIATKVSNDPFGYGFGMGYGGFGYNPYPRYVYSTQQYILDFDSGKIIDFDSDNMEDILQQRDEALYKQFMTLRRRKKRDSIFLYLRLFNQKHPIYFPL